MRFPAMRFSVLAVLMSLVLAGCGSTGGISSKVGSRGQFPREKYPELIATFVEQCVKPATADAAPAYSAMYKITRSEESCMIEVDTYYDDDTDIADLLTPELQKADSRFKRLRNSLLGATWGIGDIKKWSAEDGTPLISLGRRSAKKPLHIRRHGKSL